MQAPKRKKSKSARDMRRAHDFLTPRYSSSCPNCQAPVLSHTVCRSCGQYRGKQILQINAAS